MSPSTHQLPQTQSDHHSAVVGGALLIAIGLLILVAQHMQTQALGLLFLPALGGIFLVAGIAAHNPGFIIPGGILTGIGMGAVLTQGSIMPLSETAQGGMFLLAFAGGWFLITVLTAAFTGRTQWWALIPGTIMLLIGGGLLIGGAALNVLEFAGRWWPLILVALGLVIIVRRK